MDGIASVYVGPAGLTRIVARERQEQIGIALQGVVDPLAVSGESPAGHDNDAVAYDYRAPGAVGFEQPACPRQHLVCGRVFEMDDDEVQAACAEQVVVVVVVTPVVAAIVGSAREPGGSEVLVEQRRRARASVVVADGQPVGHATRVAAECGFKHAERCLCVEPLGLCVVVGDVTQVRHVGDVQRRRIRHHPVGLRGEHRRCATGRRGGVVLRVGQSHQREVRPRRGCCGRAPVELHGQVRGIGVGRDYAERWRLRYPGGAVAGRRKRRRVRREVHHERCPGHPCVRRARDGPVRGCANGIRNRGASSLVEAPARDEAAAAGQLLAHVGLDLSL